MKINPYWATLLLTVIIILAFTSIRGCRNNKDNYEKYQKADSLNKAQSQVIKESKATTDSIKKEYQDSLEFVRGQYALLDAQKQRTEKEMDELSEKNRVLIEKHKWDKYEDTTAVTVPQGFVMDCESCFVQLDKTNAINVQYKGEMKKLEDNWNKQTTLYQNRFTKLEQERNGFYDKIKSLTAQQQESINKLKPRGRLYLSWGILWQPWPQYAGGGLMYQTKDNMLYGAKWYYGTNGHMVETSINFPLSFKRK